MRDRRVILYSDPLQDDFSGVKVQARDIGPDYTFVHHNFLWRAAAFLLYYLIAVPAVFLISKVYLGLKFENRAVLKQLRDTGFFLYGNHTRALDAFLPALTAFPKRAYVVANPDAVSVPCLGSVAAMLGVLPIPTKFSGMRGFLAAIKQRFSQGNIVAVFPEAHIWPFYTGIRPFPDTSFRYPAQLHAPVVAMVTTYRKRRGLFHFCRRPGMTVTFSAPIFPASDRSPREAQRELREQVYDFMQTVSSRKENIEYISYRPKDAAEASKI